MSQRYISLESIALAVLLALLIAGCRQWWPGIDDKHVDNRPWPITNGTPASAGSAR